MRILLASAVACLLSVGCASMHGVEAEVEDTEEPGRTDEVAGMQPCSVTGAPDGVSSLVASARGVVFAVPASSAADAGLLLVRTRGHGCDLAADEVAPIAAGALLDVDDLGNVYVFPAEASSPGVISTMLPGEYPESMVARVDLGGRVSKLLPANRGIWGFGVSHEGDALWVTACGPSGIFEVTPDGVTSSMTAPETLWAQMPSVLTDDETFWSVGYRTCMPGEEMTPACGHALVRTTPSGSREVGSTVVDLGEGYQVAALSRCGEGVCGLVSGGVVLWDAEGEVLRTLLPVDVGALEGERIEQATGNLLGVYLLLRGEDAASRVVFVPG